MTTSDIGFIPPSSNITISPPAKQEEAGVAEDVDGEAFATDVPETAAVG